MSSGRLFLDRGGRHQSPSPLRRHPQNNSLAFRRARNYHRTAGSVLTVCVSRGDKRNYWAVSEHNKPHENALPCASRWSAIHPDHLIWVIVGDRDKIEKSVRELNLGEVKIIEAQ
jgi:hypothetical protein